MVYSDCNGTETGKNGWLYIMPNLHTATYVGPDLYLYFGIASLLVPFPHKLSEQAISTTFIYEQSWLKNYDAFWIAQIDLIRLTSNLEWRHQISDTILQTSR